jgi:hypothetical protein
MNIRKLPFSKNFALTEMQRGGSGAWVFIGRWEPAVNLSRHGSARVLCTPPGEDPLRFDWSALQGVPAVVWLYSAIDVAALAVVMRTSGAGDLLFIDVASGRFAGLALTQKSEQLLADIQCEAA